MKKRILSFLLAILMVLSIMPMPSYAQESTDATITPIETPSEAVVETPSPNAPTVLLMEQEIHPDTGKYVKLIASTIYGYVAEPNWSYVIVGSYPAFMEVSEVLEMDGVTYYRLKAAPDYIWPSAGGYSDDTVYLESTKLTFVTRCSCGQYDCNTDHTQPENPCACCDLCTGAESCACECVDCDFCEKEEPNVPSISDTVTDANGNEQTVTVSGEALPEGAELVVHEKSTDVSFLDMLFENIGKTVSYDISIGDYIPDSEVKVTISGVPYSDGETVFVIHYLDDANAIVAGAESGRIHVRNLGRIVGNEDIYSVEVAAGREAETLLNIEAAEGSSNLYFTVSTCVVSDNSITFETDSFSIYTLSNGNWSGPNASTSTGYNKNNEILMFNFDQKHYGYSEGSYVVYATPGQTVYFDEGVLGAQDLWEISGSTGNIAGWTTSAYEASFTVRSASELGYYSQVVVYDSATEWFTRYYSRVIVRIVPECTISYKLSTGSPSGAALSTTSTTTVLGNGTTNYPYAKITLPTPTTPAGYKFLGWYDVNGNRVGGAGSSYQITSNNSSSNPQATVATELYAKWEPIKYTIKFDPNTANANGGTVTGSMSNISMTYDVATTLPRNKYINSGDGMVFLGWAISPTGDVVHKDGAQISNLTTTDGATVTLYAKWKYGLASTVYIGINNTYHDPNGTYTAGGVTIPSYHAYPNEPAKMTGNFDRVTDSSGSWTYDSESAVPLKGQASAYINGNIFNSPDYEMTYVANENTLGIADPTGKNVRSMLKFTEADYQAMIVAWLNGMRTTLVGYGDTTFDWQNAKAEDFVMVPYVIKFQDYNSWYIDMAVVPKALYTLAYDGNIENGYTATFTGVAFPPSAQYTDGSSVAVVTTPIGYNSNNLKVTKVVDGHTYTAVFQYWYDANGNTYGGTTGRNTITLTEDTILYAKWEYPDASYGNLNITKHVVDKDAYENPVSGQSFTFKFTTSASGNYNYTVYDTSANVKASGTIANDSTFTLQDGWRVRITDLPKDASYSVTENAVPYYTPSSVSGRISAGATIYATVTNTYQKNADYTVKHYLQNVDKTGYVEQTEDTQQKYGVIGTKTSAQANTYSGYTVKSFSQTEIKADGSTVISIYYDLVSTATVIWKNYDGTVLEIDENVAHGTKPSYDGETPEKAATAQYTYIFDDWDKEVVAVTGDVTYTAKFRETVNKYTVTFVDEDGTTILKEATKYEYGTKAEDIVKPANPSKETTAEYTYTFEDWSPEIADVTANVTYKATYTKVKNRYTMTGWIENGTVSNAMTVDYGESAELYFTPHTGYEMVKWRISTESADRTFSSPLDSKWRYGITELKQDVTVTVYTEPIQYTITYELIGGALAEGVTNPEIYTIETENFSLHNPTKEGYKFMGWAIDQDGTELSTNFTITKGTTGNKIFYAIWERSLVDLTITADCADQEQSFIFTVSGTRSDGIDFDSIEVVLCSDNSFKVTIKDLPVGKYTVTEKDGWSWREKTVESKIADLSTTSQTVHFDFESVDDLHWLSGYSYKRKKGGSE